MSNLFSHSFSPRRLAALLATMALLLQSGCSTPSWLDWTGLGEGDSTPAAPTGAARTTPATASEPADPSSATAATLADRRLARIVAQQNAVYGDLAASVDQPLDAEQENRLANIASQYDSFLTEAPDHLYGHILYGKFLRDVGEFDQANIIFLRANQIDPNVAVVKQQIGNHFAETGQYVVALPYFLAAAELEPNAPVYHYQLGELIDRYRDFLIDDGAYQRDALDQQMLAAFRRAAELDGGNLNFHFRYAEAYFDVQTPQWSDALAAWQEIAAMELSERERDVARLQTARVLIELNRSDEALPLIDAVTNPTLLPARDELRRIAVGSE